MRWATGTARKAAISCAVGRDQVRQPPFLEGLLRLGLHVRKRVAQGDLLEKGSQDAFLVGAECPQPRRVFLGRTQRSHQRLSDHRGIVWMPERVVDQTRQIVAPGTGVEIRDPPEGESFEVRITGLVRRGIERHRLVVAVHGVGSAQRQRRRSHGVGSKNFERAGDNGCGAHATKSSEPQFLQDRIRNSNTSASQTADPK